MAEQVKIFWVNLVVGILGLGVGLSYLLKLPGDDSSARDLVFGIICLVLATGWLSYVFFSRKHDQKQHN
jgi:hypothetical protein